MATVEQSRSITGKVTMPDGVELFSRSWPVDGARASVALAHGYGEHCGRYEHIAAKLNADGYSVFTYDQRAHGNSLGTLGYVPSFDRLVEDFSAFNEQLAKRLGHPAEFVFGHSMGALVAALHTERTQPAVKGLVLSSGALKVDDSVPLHVRILTTLLSRFLPKFPVHQIDAKGLSHIEAEVTAYETDPLVYHGKLQARSAYVMMQGIAEAAANATKITQPLLVLHGTDDAVAACDGSRELYAAAGSTDKTLKLYDGAYHEVFNDDQKALFLQDVVDWLNARA